MPVMQQCPEDHPLMIAWKAYQSGEDYQNSYRWATAGIEPPPITERNPTANYPTADTYRQYVVGSLWAAFIAGFTAAGDRTAVPHDPHCWFMKDKTRDESAGPFDTKEQGLAWAKMSAGRYEDWEPLPLYTHPAVPYDQREPELGWLQGEGETIRERRPSDPVSPGKGEGWREERKQILDLIDTLSRRRVVPSFVDLKEAIHALPSPPISSRAEEVEK